MKDIFGNKKPVAIEIDEWWFNGRIIQKQNDYRLPKYISFTDNSENYFVSTHSNMKDATFHCLINPCKNPDRFPKDYIGGL